MRILLPLLLVLTACGAAEDPATDATTGSTSSTSSTTTSTTSTSGAGTTTSTTGTHGSGTVGGFGSTATASSSTVGTTGTTTTSTSTATSSTGSGTTTGQTHAQCVNGCDARHQTCETNAEQGCWQTICASYGGSCSYCSNSALCPVAAQYNTCLSNHDNACQSTADACTAACPP